MVNSTVPCHIPTLNCRYLATWLWCSKAPTPALCILPYTLLLLKTVLGINTCITTGTEQRDYNRNHTYNATHAICSYHIMGADDPVSTLKYRHTRHDSILLSPSPCNQTSDSFGPAFVMYSLHRGRGKLLQLYTHNLLKQPLAINVLTQQLLPGRHTSLNSPAPVPGFFK